MGAQVFLTDLPDRLRLLKKNVETNLKQGDLRGSAVVQEFTWGDDPEPELIEPLPDYGNNPTMLPFFTNEKCSLIFATPILAGVKSD